jgi:photosystem II stability/assembly factor-like uncharacterized protein
MKRNSRQYACIILLFSICPTVVGQWNWQTPLPQGNNLLHVQFVDGTFGWASGEYGTVLHTSTGGSTWYEQEYARTDNVLSVSMISGDVGWAAGDNGIILYTTDNGDTWSEQSSGITSGLNAITFVDPANGWAAGDNEIILHTTDGGLTWNVQHQSVTPSSINDIKFLNAAEGWGVGSNRSVFHTTDSGATWISQQLGTTPAYYSSISFGSASVGCIVGSNGAILRTSNGGLTWINASSGVGAILNDVSLESATVGWAVADGGLLLKTTDGGASWSNTTIAGDGLSSVSRFGTTLWIVGEYGVILKSTDGGNSWNRLDTESRLSANWIDAPSLSAGTVVGQDGLILRTTDGGASWAQQASPVPSVSCYGVKFTDRYHGWAVGDEGTILRTTNGGTWTVQPSNVSHFLFGVTFAGTSGWIVGGEFSFYTGIILHSSDGGNSWGTQLNGVSNILFGLDFADANSGWAVGENGLILHTTNGGANWTPQSSGTTLGLFWCAFADALNGWAVGDVGTIIHTTDGGTSWTAQNSGTDELLFSVTAPTVSHVMISGDHGTILETTDGGAHWEPRYSRTLYGLFGVASASDTTFWVCGDFGTILKDGSPPPLTGEVSGKIFNDLDSNGASDPGEYDLYGWKVTISGVISASTYTAGDGTFSLTDLPFGSYTLSEVLQPGWTQTQPAPPGTYSLTLDDDTLSFSGDFGNHPDAGTNTEINFGWNLLSLPVLVADPRLNVVFPTAISQLFSYNGSYIAMDSIIAGHGYWLKFSSWQHAWVFGSPFHDATIPVRQGWNIIGCTSDSVQVSAIVTEPANIISSPLFGYNNGYQVVSKLGAGAGYWVKCTEPGQIVLNSSTAQNKKVASQAWSGLENLPGMNTLTFRDASGYSHVLYFGMKTEENLLVDRLALPPIPPAGCPDVRFGNDSEAALFDTAKSITQAYRISLAGLHYPVRMVWNMQRKIMGHVYLTNPSTSGRIASLDSDFGEIILSDPSTRTLEMEMIPRSRTSSLPKEFALLQNVPNPFNPSTRIEYTLPVSAHVQLKIYNILGQEIVTLVDEAQDAGFKSVEWNVDRSRIATGVYMYKLTAANFVDVKKLVVEK